MKTRSTAWHYWHAQFLRARHDLIRLRHARMLATAGWGATALDALADWERRQTGASR